MNTPHGSSARPSSGPPWTALLNIAGPGGHKASLPFRPPRVIVGRRRTNDLALPDQGVSSSHCEFVVESGWFVVRDLASINGTFVNDRRISEARLRDGDVVRLGGTRITVALQGSLRGAKVWSLDRLREQWLWLLGAVLLLLGLSAGLFFWQRMKADEQRLRLRYAVEVRALLQADPCGAVASRIDNLAALDARIAGRPVPMAAPGQTLSPQLKQAAVELLGLYRAKAEESAQALQELAAEQQKEKEAFERVGRLSARLRGSQDRKIAFFAQSQLNDRLQLGETLVNGIAQLAKEAHRFAELVEAVGLRGDDALAPELVTFRFAAPAAAWQLDTCRTALARSNAGALGAINGLADE